MPLVGYGSIAVPVWTTNLNKKMPTTYHGKFGVTPILDRKLRLLSQRFLGRFGMGEFNLCYDMGKKRLAPSDFTLFIGLTQKTLPPKRVMDQIKHILPRVALGFHEYVGI